MKENLDDSINLVLRLQQATLDKAEICLNILKIRPRLADEVQAILIDLIKQANKEIDMLVGAIITLNERRKIFGDEGIEKDYTYED